MAKEKLSFFYDRLGDVLYISIDSPEEAISVETEDDILLRIHPETKEILGFTILNFAGRFSNIEKERTIPIKAQFEQLNHS